MTARGRRKEIVRMERAKSRGRPPRWRRGLRRNGHNFKTPPGERGG